MLYFFIIFFVLFIPSNGLVLEGELSSDSKWEFIARFCYQTENGLVDYYFEYMEDFCCQDAILYYDSQWNRVYPGESSQTCQEKVEVASLKNHQVLPLVSGTNGCKKTSTNGVTRITCKGYRSISSTIPRWWYLVISNCDSTKGLALRYKMIMTNGDSFWNRHFSADEQNILEMDIFFLIVQTCLFIISIYVAHALNNRQLFHTTYKLYLWAIFLEILSILINMVYYIEYGLWGKPAKGVKNVGRGCHCISDTIMVVLLILLGKGWTVTRARISPSGQIKLSVFCTLYGISYVALFIYEAKAFDPGKVLYIYESPAGVGICIMKVIAWIWFCYGVFFTLKNYAEKRFFYFPFFSFYTLWFLSGPVIVLIAAESIDPNVREQTMNGVDRTVAFIAFTFFMILTRPSAANKNFPYHVRTTQIGFIDDSANPNFETATYQPSTETVQLNRRLSLFSAVTGNQHMKRGDSSSPLNGSLSRTPITENGHAETSFGHVNKAYCDNPPLYRESPHPNSSYPPTIQNKPPTSFNVSNFVIADGTICNEKQQTNSHSGLSSSESTASEAPLIRTNDEVTSMFQAKVETPAPPPLTPLPISNAPSPSFMIPEPSTTSKHDDTPSPTHHGNNNKPHELDHTLNGFVREPNQAGNESPSGATGDGEKKTNETLQESGDLKANRKKSKKKSKKKKQSSHPDNLPPITGSSNLPPAKLPPLRGGRLPPLSREESII